MSFHFAKQIDEVDGAAEMIGVIDRLRQRGSKHDNKVAVRFLTDGENEALCITFGELHRRASNIGRTLYLRGCTGRPVVVAQSPGIGYIEAIYGCLYAGAIAVPAFPPSSRRSATRLSAILRDSKASVALLSSQSKEYWVRFALEESGIVVLLTDQIPNLDSDWDQPNVQPSSPAYIQYTSGTTQSPKGTVITNRNLTHSIEVIRRAYELDHIFEEAPDGVGVFWLPPQHDMGLVGGILAPIHLGCGTVLMAPQAFAERPSRWLRAIGNFNGVVSAAPNFAFDLCTRTIADSDLGDLDLRNWKVAISGAEPIMHRTLRDFSARFAKYGFTHGSHSPSYGLAEATIAVSAWLSSDTVSSYPLSVQESDGYKLVAPPFQKNEQSDLNKLIVGCGTSAPGHILKIVDPVTNRPCNDGKEGEIWVFGPGVAKGYWGHDSESTRTFHARMASDDPREYLRTGDLGFILSGCLFVTGRSKDALVLRGQNFHPKDIEAAAYNSHSALLPACVAFTSPSLDGDELVIVQEVTRSACRALDTMATIAPIIFGAIAQEHGLRVSCIVLTRPGAIPRTSSNKLQRDLCKSLWNKRELKLLLQWRPSSGTSEAVSQSEMSELIVADHEPDVHPSGNGHDKSRSTWNVQTDMKQLLDAVLPEASTHPCTTLSERGLDSLTAARLAYLIEQKFTITVSLEDILRQPDVAGLSRIIENSLEARHEKPNNALVFPPSRREEVDADSNTIPPTDLQIAYLTARTLSPSHANASCKVGVDLELSGTLDEERLRKSLRHLVARHPMLTVRFHSDGRQSLQNRGSEHILKFFDLKNYSPLDAEARCADLRNEIERAEFNPDLGFLFACTACHLPQNRFRLILAIDLLVADFHSIAIVLKELRQLYEDGNSSLPEIRFSVEDYFKQLKVIRSGERYQHHVDYWRGKLASFPKAPSVMDNLLWDAKAQRTLFTVLPKSLWTRLRTLAQEQRLTPTALLAASFCRAIYRRTGESRFCLNVPIANRLPLHRDVDRLVGPFASNILVDVNWEQDKTLGEFWVSARSVLRTILEALQHSLCSGVEVARELAKRSGRPFESTGSVVFTPIMNSGLGGWGHVKSLFSRTPQVLLDCQALGIEDELWLRWDYQSSKVDSADFSSWFHSFVSDLHEIASEKGVPQVTLYRSDWAGKMRRDSERGETGSGDGHLGNRTLHGAFEEMVFKNPHLRAVVVGEECATYRELNEQADLVAIGLLNRGVRTGDRVGILIERSVPLIAAIIGVLKAGAVYVPIDLRQPSQRIIQILSDCGARLLSSRKHGAPFATELPIYVEDLTFSEPNERPRASEIAVEQVAYIIYTSGSSGNPKGVVLSHRAAMNTIEEINRRFSVSRFDRVLGLASIAFDLSVFDIFGTLAAGATLIIPQECEMLDPSQWLNLIKRYGVTIWNSVPFAMKLMLDCCASDIAISTPVTLRLALLSGDWIPLDLPGRIKSYFPRVKVVSLGGATEAGIWSCVYVVDQIDPKWRSIPYGTPLDNQGFEILDDAGQAVPAGEIGELCITGDSLALGYWNLPELTMERFRPTANSALRGYRTGDRGRLTKDGLIEFLGRKDEQVKIRGHRVELGEIEAQLNRHPQIDISIVTAARGSEGEIELTAHLVSKIQLESKEISSYLRERLPEYMVPLRFIKVEVLPLNANGKVDRTRLRIQSTLEIQ